MAQEEDAPIEEEATAQESEAEVMTPKEQLDRLRGLDPAELKGLVAREDELLAVHRARFCPCCGAPMHDAMAELDAARDQGGHDCYCKLCEWSGDIYPDALTDMTERLLEWVEKNPP